MFNKRKTQKKKKKEINKGYKYFFYIAPLIGLLFGYIYVKNKGKIEISKEEKYNEEYILSDKELIEILDDKLKNENRIIKDWLNEKVDEKIKQTKKKK